MDLVDDKRQKHDWEPMRLRYVGDVAEILRLGGTKLSLTGGDPGEPRKENAIPPHE